MMGTLHSMPHAFVPMPAVARILGRFDRDSLSGFIEVAIGLLDVMEGDVDCEPEEDCCMAGDDLARSGPIVIDANWRGAIARGEQPGDADEHEPWQASRETQDYRE